MATNIATFPPGRDTPMLIVSPHLDDAVLSCWSLIDREAVEVLTVFAGRPAVPVSTDYDRACGYADSEGAMTGRLSEDDAALTHHGVSTRRLDLLDIGYAAAPPRPFHDVSILREAVWSWVARHDRQRTLVLLPAGTGLSAGLITPAGGVVASQSQSPGDDSQNAPASDRRSLGLRVLAARFGGRWIAHRVFLWRKRRGALPLSPAHPDHVWVRDVLLPGLLEHPRADVVLYEELPYLWELPADDAVAEIQNTLDVRASEFHLPVDQDAKMRRVGHYGTQLRVLDPVGGRLTDASAYPPIERFWKIARRPEAAERPSERSLDIR